MEKKQFQLYFSECEHADDSNRYQDDLREAGAEVTACVLDYAGESCLITIQLAEGLSAFKKKFQESDSYDFLSLSY